MQYRGVRSDTDSTVRVRILSHTHWDREWYLPSRYTGEWLGPFFDALLDRFEEDHEYRFSLDGQTILIEDFLKFALCGAPGDVEPADQAGTIDPVKSQRRSPEEIRTALVSYAREGRLAIGPYYQQPDWNLAGGEALIRNLLIGVGDVEALCEGGAAGAMPPQEQGPAAGSADTTPPLSYAPAAARRIGWLPDNFGQIAQTVQIHRLFGISELVTWRGIGLSPNDISTELIWRGPDGSEAFTLYLVDSYRNSMQLLAEPEIVSERISWAVDRLRPFARTPLALLLNGYDQEVEPEPIPAALRALRTGFDDIRQVTLPEYFREMRAELEENPPAEHEQPHPFRIGGCGSGSGALPEIVGSQYDGRYISVFPGVLSARSYLKIANRRCEMLLSRIVEPLATFAWLKSGLHPTVELDLLWRKLLRNHPHDSLCGVSVDPVHTDMERRFAGVEAGAREIIEQCSSGSSASPVVFNPSPWPRRIVVGGGMRQQLVECQPLAIASIAPRSPAEGGDEPEAAEAVPATGTSPGEYASVEPLEFEQRSWRIRSAAYDAEVESDGTLTVTDRATGRRFRGLATLVDDGDAGDTYNYSPPSHDREVRSSGTNAQRRVSVVGPYESVLEAALNLDLPSALTETREARSKQTVGIPVTIRYRFCADSPLIGISVTVDNLAREHRLRLHFPSDLVGSEFHRETQHYIERTPIGGIDAGRSEDLPPHVARVMLGAREREPIHHFPQNRFSLIRDDDGMTLAVFNRGLPEIEAIAERSTLALTLLRSIGWLARPDLASRIGDAGPMIYSPDAYCLRRTTFDAAVAVGRLDDADVLRHAEEFALPLEQFDADPIRFSTGTLSIDNRLLSLSALKRSESGHALVVRLWNSCDRRTTGRLTFGFPVAAVRATAADEATLDERTIDETSDTSAITVTCCAPCEYSLDVGPWAIVTLVVEPADPPPEGGAETIVSERTDLGDHARFGDNGHDSAGGRLRDVPPLDEADVRAEYERWLGLARERDAAARELECYRGNAGRSIATDGDSAGDDGERPGGAEAIDRECAELRSRHSTLVRAALEAELSWVLNREKLRQWDAGELLPAGEAPSARGEIRRIGNELNHARIAKRLDDYLLSMAREKR